MFLSVGAAVMGFKPQASPKVIQTPLFQTKHFGLTKVAFKKALPLCLSVYLCICLLTKCFTGIFPATLSRQAELCEEAAGRRGNAGFACIVGLSLTSPSHKRCMQTWPACQEKSLTLGSFECLSSFPKMLRETCVRMSLAFSSIWAPSPLLKISGHFKRPWV